MPENFTPPQMPTPLPQAPGSNADANTGQLRNYAPNQESMGNWSKSVARSAQIKAATGTVIKTRAQFKKYLQENGMDLYTSAVEFQQNGDFILSSYVVYQNYNGQMESLSSFLQRYPSLQQPVIAIRDQLRPIKSQMQIVTPKLSKPNPFGSFADL